MSKSQVLIENLAKKKTAWLKDFIESQKKKPQIETVETMHKKLTSN